MQVNHKNGVSFIVNVGYPHQSCFISGQSEFEINVVFLGQTAEVDDGVAHSAQSSVDTDTGACGYILEVAFAVVSQYYHTALLGRQHFDEFSDIAVGLLTHDVLLHVFIVQFEGVNNVTVGTVGHNGHFAVASEMVHNKIVGNTHNPMDEFVFIFVVTRIEGGHHLEEGVLENVVGYVFVLNYGEDVTVYLGLITGKEYIETGTIAIDVALYQLVVGERAK